MTARWGLRLLGVLLLPMVCMAHGAAVVWLYEKGAPTLLLGLLSLIIFLLLGVAALLLGVAALLLGVAALGLWVEDTENRMPVAFMLLALGALAAGYLGTLRGAELWVLEWRGIETTCTVRHVLELGGDTAEAPSPVIRDYRLECAAADAPDTMRSMWFNAESGESIPVVYDPAGQAGVHAEREVDDAGAWAWGTGIAMAAWTVLTLANVCLDLPRSQPEDAQP